MKELHVSEKYTLSIREAAQYFGIGERKLRALAHQNNYDGFAVYNGNRLLIIRTKFEQFLAKTSAI